MTMRTLIIISIAFTLNACSARSSATSQNTSNAQNTNASLSTTSSSTTGSDSNKGAGKNLSPTTMDVDDFTRGYDETNDGRIVTVTGGELDSISSTYLLIRDIRGYGFNCNGSFGEYMSMQSRIDDLRMKHRSPTVTVKGVYTEGQNRIPDLSSCILLDIKK